MRFILGLVLVLCGTVNLRADVGITRLNKDSQELRSGDRFRISVSKEEERFCTISFFIKKREGERPIRADLTVGRGRNADAMIPVKMTAAKNGAGFYISLQMTREFAKKSELAILVDFTGEDGIQSGTSFQIDLGSYFNGP
jgi:hypothetical protein